MLPERSTVSLHRFSAPVSSSRLAALLSCLAAAALTACGGGAEGGVAPAAVESAATAPPPTTDAAAFAGVQAQPTFHMAPAQLEEPTDADAASAAPRRFDIDGDLAGLSTAGLTPERLAASQRARVAAAGGSKSATAIPAAVYTPAQIRAAYGLAAVPASTASLSAADAASLGAGQTIYIVDAYDHPNAYADLAKFSAKFGLPACTNVTLASTAALPLAKASTTAGCTFSVAYTDSRATLLAAAPAYNADWIAEIALDVQWAHAIAPLARLVLIEAADANSNNLQGGIALANKMGSGVVSMSFGAAEGSWVKSSDTVFTTANMTYLASAGDDGAQALWPAVSPNVLAVGGTSLQWSGSGTRYEAAWASSGGGVSAYESLPSWQSGVVVPGVGAAKMRTVSDVAFNADPTTGQYVALTAKGSATTTWNAYGGTSIGAPQWAGLVAVANARRAAASKALLGDFHATLYKTIAGSASSYASVFSDIVAGSDGGCASCVTAKGYDTVTGWGTPNAGKLLDLLATDTTGSSSTPVSVVVAVAPTVPGGTFSAQTGTAFTASLGVTVPANTTVSYALSGAPNGLTVNSVGYVNWTSPVAGSYSFTATATTNAGKSASAKYTLTVVKVNHAPTLASATIAVKANAALKATLSGVDIDGDAMTYTMTGAPSGMALSSAGVLTWSKAVKGSYALKVTVKDSHGLAGAVATITVNVTA
jgi:subtilase family serine protease